MSRATYPEAHRYPEGKPSDRTGRQTGRVFYFKTITNQNSRVLRQDGFSYNALHKKETSGSVHA